MTPFDPTHLLRFVSGNIVAFALSRWLLCIEDGYYEDNPYHNAIHAADVLQTFHVLLMRGGLVPTCVTSDLVHLACYLAAIVHDVGE